MAFVLPTFNLVCDIFTGATTNPAARRIQNQPCQLRAPSMTQIVGAGTIIGGTSSIVLLLPPGTDIRDPYTTAGSGTFDTVEVIPGSGRVYRVYYVDDIGKGFPNEHRYACLSKVPGFPWPIPIP